MKQNDTKKEYNAREVQENSVRGFSPFPPQYQEVPYRNQNPVAGIKPSILPNPFMTEQGLTPEHELELLRQQAHYIESNLQWIQQRIHNCKSIE